MTVKDIVVRVDVPSGAFIVPTEKPCRSFHIPPFKMPAAPASLLLFLKASHSLHKSSNPEVITKLKWNHLFIYLFIYLIWKWKQLVFMAGKITVRVFSVFFEKKEARVSQFLVSCDNYQRVALCFHIKLALFIVSFFHSFWKSRCFGYPFFLCHPQLWCFSVLFPGDSHWLTLAGSLLLCSHNVFHKGPRRLRALCVI